MSTHHHRGILERRPGIWYARYMDAEGHDRWKKAGAKTAAILLYEKLRKQASLERAMPELRQRQAIPFAELVEDCLLWSEHNKLSWWDDRLRMKRVIERFGEKMVSDVNVKSLEAFKRDLIVEGLSGGTINRIFALLSLTFKLARQIGKVTDNPCSKIKRVRENPHRTRYLSEDEEARLRDAIRNPRNLLELDVAIHTGMRQSEQYGMEWPAVDLSGKVLTISRSKHGATRHIPLNEEAESAFRTLSESRNGDRRVFGICSPKKWFDTAIDKAKIEDFTWHDLRHTFGSRLAMSGVSMKSIQELMGHRSILTTMRYAHLSPEYQREAVKKLSSYSLKSVAEKNHKP